MAESSFKRRETLFESTSIKKNRVKYERKNISRDWGYRRSKRIGRWQ